jgi:hypothetical protein
MLRISCISVLAACGATTAIPRSETDLSKRSAECREEVRQALGTRTLYTIAASDSISAPQTCATSQPEEAYIRVTGSGARPLSLAPKARPIGCTTPDGACDSVDLGAFLTAVGVKLHARGIAASTHGIGRCGRPITSENWQDRHMSITIYAWQHANAAVTILEEEMRVWNVSGAYEVSVEHMVCTVAGAESAQL